MIVWRWRRRAPEINVNRKMSEDHLVEPTNLSNTLITYKVICNLISSRIYLCFNKKYCKKYCHTKCKSVRQQQIMYSEKV